MSTHSPLVWQNPDWLEQASEWIHAEAARHSITITDKIEQSHIYPWSTVMRVPTREGILFFKATAAETVHETALTAALATWYPDCMPKLVAVDTTRGWMLMRDGGEQLRSFIRPNKDIAPWEPVISRYAEVQVGLTQHISQLLSLGAPDRRLAVLPGLYAQLLTEEKSLMIDQPKGLTSPELQQLQDLTARFEQICTELASAGIPESLNHGDFHDGNVLLRDGRITFFDWGDADVTHPFISLRSFFVSIESSLQLEDYAFTPEMSALLDRYLEAWQKFAAKEALLSAYRLSKPVAAFVTVLKWHQGISRMDGPLREEYAWIVPEVLREFMLSEKTLSD